MHKGLGNGYFKGIYRNGSIHTSTFSIRCKDVYPFSEDEKIYGAEIYLDELDRPYLMNVFELDEVFIKNNSIVDSYCFVIIKPYNKSTLQIVDINGNYVLVDFTIVKEPRTGIYKYIFEYRNNIWTLVITECLHSVDS